MNPACPKHDLGGGPCYCEEQSTEPSHVGIPSPFWMFLLGVAALYWIAALLIIQWVLP